MKVNIVRPQPIRPKLTKYIVITPDPELNDNEWFDDEEVNKLMDFFTGEMGSTATCWRYVIVNTEQQTVDYLDRKPSGQTTFVCLSEFNKSQYWANAFDHLNISFGSVRDIQGEVWR